MAKSSKKAESKQTGNSLVIVESPAKARTISKFLGERFKVEASIGHIRDLPTGKKEMPESLKSQPWARLGVNVDENFDPVYIVPSNKKRQVSKLKKLLDQADALYLATDEDREGEAISWHLREVLKPKVPVRRLVFHEITRSAIEQSLEHPRDIDLGLVRAQETRRILDRLYGYEVSEFLWKKSLGRSAGRVQSVAVRLIVDREWERMRFVSATWWDLVGTFSTNNQETLKAELISVDGRHIPEGKDFDSSTGRIKNPELLLLDETEAKQLAQRLVDADYEVSSVEVKPYSRSPSAPFTTSTLQQEANRKLGFTAKRTMRAAQNLYENGYITYMRTDSTTLSDEAIQAARQLVCSEYGDAYLPDSPRVYPSKVKNAQEAHEAIRPAGTPFQFPNQLRGELPDDEFKLFELIWKRTVASQMANARGQNILVTISGGGAVFQVSGKTIEFPGFLRAYVEGSDDPAAELADQETILPSVVQGQRLVCLELDVKSRSTQPPARYSEASLTRELERLGIGRPSTFASIIETIQDRKYVLKRGNYLVPTWSAFAVIRLLEEHFQNLVDYEFTAQMEDLLDAISRGESDATEYLRNFYFGDGASGPHAALGLRPQLDAKIKEVDAREICTFTLNQPADVGSSQPISVRVGRFGVYVERGSQRASVPDDLAPDELSYEKAVELLAHSSIAEKPLGFCPETGRPVFLKQGRFGPYVQLGPLEDGEKTKNASLLKDMQPADVTLDIALKLLSLPRELGLHPDDHRPIQAFNGKFGPYLKWGDESRSLPRDVSLFDVTLEQAVALFRQPKPSRGGRRAAAPRMPIREFGTSPLTGQTMKLLKGPYGLYLTDGETNVTLPKDTVVEQLTDEFVSRLLADKAAQKSTQKRVGTAVSRKKSAVQSTKSPKKKGANRRTKKTSDASE